MSGDKLLSNTYGNKYYGPDSIDVRDKSFSDDICVCDGYATILDDPLTSEIESSLKSLVFFNLFFFKIDSKFLLKILQNYLTFWKKLKYLLPVIL